MVTEILLLKDKMGHRLLRQRLRAGFDSCVGVSEDRQGPAHEACSGTSAKNGTVDALGIIVNMSGLHPL